MARLELPIGRTDGSGGGNMTQPVATIVYHKAATGYLACRIRSRPNERPAAPSMTTRAMKNIAAPVFYGEYNR